MNRTLMRYGWKKEKVFSPPGKKPLVRYRITSTKKMDRDQARKSLGRLGEAVEARDDVERVSFASLSCRLDYMGVGEWRITMTVELYGVEQLDFNHLMR